MDTITPTCFCENETVNLILSAFATKAKQGSTMLTVDAKLPDLLPFSDTELCSLLSNALENAIQATKNRRFQVGLLVKPCRPKTASISAEICPKIADRAVTLGCFALQVEKQQLILL